MFKRFNTRSSECHKQMTQSSITKRVRGNLNELDFIIFSYTFDEKIETSMNLIIVCKAGSIAYTRQGKRETKFDSF